MKMSEAIAKRTANLLKEHNMTKYALHKKTLMPKTTVQNILDATANDTTVTNVLRIATAFDMTLAEFLDFDELNNFSFDDDEE